MATTTQVLGKVGLVDKGVYDVNEEYNRLDFVTDENNISTYISKVDNNQGHSLEDPEYWRFLAKGTADAATIRDLLKTVDGAGSGIDADTLDGTQLEEIVNPEALAAASPFDYFLGAKEVDGKWVFKKMSPSDVATVVAGLLPIASSSNNGLQPILNHINAAPYVFSTSNGGKDQLFRIFRNNEAHISVAELHISGMYTGCVYAKIIAHDSYVEVVCDKEDYINVYKDNNYIYIRLNYSKLGDWSRSVCKIHTPATYTFAYANVTESVSVDNLTLVY